MCVCECVGIVCNIKCLRIKPFDLVSTPFVCNINISMCVCVCTCMSICVCSAEIACFPARLLGCCCVLFELLKFGAPFGLRHYNWVDFPVETLYIY